jgi:hypothetical protein
VTADVIEQGAGPDADRPPADPIHVDTPTAAVAVNVAQGTIRSWASRGHIRAVGRDRRGRTLYDLQQVMDTAQKFV